MNFGLYRGTSEYGIVNVVSKLLILADNSVVELIKDAAKFLGEGKYALFGIAKICKFRVVETGDTVVFVKVELNKREVELKIYFLSCTL